MIATAAKTKGKTDQSQHIRVDVNKPHRWRPERECEERDLLPQPASSSIPVDTLILADFSSFSPLSTTNAATVSW